MVRRDCFLPWPHIRLYVWQLRDVPHSKILRSFQANMLLLICAMYLKKKAKKKKILLVVSSYKREFYIVFRRLNFVKKVGATGLTFSNLVSPRALPLKRTTVRPTCSKWHQQGWCDLREAIQRLSISENYLTDVIN